MRKALFVALIQATLVTALVVVAGRAAPAEAQENQYDTPIDVRMGERVFRAQCGRCHGRDARGNDETGAPDLTTGQFSRVSSDAGMFDVIREGIDGTAMIGISPRASDQTVWQIVSYINSLNLDPGDYDLPGDAARGEQVYAGANCATCHMIRGEGGRTGPDLSTVGSRLDPDELATSLSDPDARGGSALVDDAHQSSRRLDHRRAADERGHVHRPHHGQRREPLELHQERGPLGRTGQDLHHAGLRGSERERRGRPGRLPLLAAQGELKMKRLATIFVLIALALPAAAPAQDDEAPSLRPVTWERLLNAVDEPENWLMYSGTLDSQRYSRLDQIHNRNVGNLVLKWAYQIPEIDRAETTPLVVDGVMFVTEAPSNVVALRRGDRPPVLALRPRAAGGSAHLLRGATTGAWPSSTRRSS